jgi:hypothetical protein
MPHDLANRLTAAFAADRRLAVGTTEWALHLCGISFVGDHLFVHVAAVGHATRTLTVRIHPQPERFTTQDVRDAIVVRLEVDEVGDDFPVGELEAPCVL